jgi:hypothetical protein
MNFVAIIEQAAIPSTFTHENSSLLINLFEFNSSNNGLHVARMFFYKKRIISFAEYLHYLDLSTRFDLNLVNHLKYLDHVCYFRTTSNNMIIATLFTNEAISVLNGVEPINNVNLGGFPYRYANSPIIATPLDFFHYF